jgi:hypothetical protein
LNNRTLPTTVRQGRLCRSIGTDLRGPTICELLGHLTALHSVLMRLNGGYVGQSGTL